MHSKHGGVKLVAIRAADGLEVNVGTAADYRTGREHARLLLDSSSQWSRIQVRNAANKRILTVTR